MNSAHVLIKYSDTAVPEHVAFVRQYIEKFNQSGLDPVLSMEHFSLLVGLKSDRVFAMCNGTGFFYRSFEIPKKSGGKRKISAPLPSLLMAQRWILSHILEKVEIHPAAKAYIKGSSIKNNARLHRKQNILLKLDVKNFFDSISEFRIYEIFHSLGYIGSVSTFLTKLCCLNGCLPQGAATSGYLSNILLKSVDDGIFKYCRDRGLRYSRYADDISISGEEFDVSSLKRLIAGYLGEVGLKVNRGKTSVRRRHVRQEVTGIVVNERMSPGRLYLRKLRQELYYIQKFGVYAHSRAIGDASPIYTIQRLIGQVAFATYIVGSLGELKNFKKELISLRNKNFTHI